MKPTPTSDAILAAARDLPGVTSRRIERMTGIPIKAVCAKVCHLRERGLLVSLKVDGAYRHFAAGYDVDSLRQLPADAPPRARPPKLAAPRAPKPSVSIPAQRAEQPAIINEHTKITICPPVRGPSYAPTGQFERVITGDWMLARQASTTKENQ